MGTSADRTAGSGGSWTPLKLAVNSYIRSLSSNSPNTSDYARRLLSRQVAVLGGASSAAGSAAAGRAGAQRLGALLSGIGENGLADTLRSLDLARLVGLDRFDVLDELIEFVAGDGGDLDSWAARDATCDVLDEVFGDADTWTELTGTSEGALSREAVVALLEVFMTQYIYNRIPVIAERLGRITDPQALAQADKGIRDNIQSFVSLRMPEDPYAVDWAGTQGREVVDDVIRYTYEALEHLDGEE